jgi:hypothetical protein
MIRGSNHIREKGFISSQNFHTISTAHPASYPTGTEDSFPEVKQ